MIDHDEMARHGLEELSNRVSRHRLLAGAAKGIFAITTALAVGSIGLKTAWASVGCCCSAPTECNGCPGGCITNVFDSGHLCPSGFSLCTDTSCAYCSYSSGYWGCACGYNLYYCADCWKGSYTGCGGNGDASNGPCTCATRSCYSTGPN